MVSHAIPAAFSGPLFCELVLDRDLPFLSLVRSVINIDRFCRWLGLGLRDTCLVGTGRGGRSSVCRLFDRCVRLSVLFLERNEGLGGRRGGLEGFERSGYWGAKVGGSDSRGPPGNVAASLAFSCRRASFSASRSAFSASFRLFFMTSRISTLSLHCSSNCFRDSNRAFSVSVFGT